MAPRTRSTRPKASSVEMPIRRSESHISVEAASSGWTIMDDAATNNVCDQPVKRSPTPDEGYNTGNTTDVQSPAELSHANLANGPSNPDGAIEKLGASVKDLVSAINRLEQFGVESSELPLPRIVVIGDQSAGKSSVVEAISEIKVPRASGTCTRCPIQINLTTDATQPWSCILKLHKKFSFFGRKGSQNLSSSPWKEQVEPQDIWTSTVNSKADLEVLLERAQTATLNPSESPEKVMIGTTPSKNQVAFSPNVIQLDIKGPTLPTLTLYDLPGIINQAEHDSDDENLVDLVYDLVEKYVQSDLAIVVLCRPMAVDPATSSAGALITQLKAQTRCLGVLTKPDRLPEGDSLDQWSQLLNNHTFKLGHGYFVTKQPSQKELNDRISHAEARKREKSFFEECSPWNQDFNKYHDRFGTENLQHKLSQMLAQMIARSLPSIKAQIQSKIANLQSDLATLPKAPGDSCLSIIIGLIAKFESELSKVMAGEFPHNDFILQFLHHADVFKQTLDALKPKLAVSTGPEAGWKGHSQAEPISVDDEDDDSSPSPRTGSKRPLADSTPPVTPTPKRPRTGQTSSSVKKGGRLLTISNYNLSEETDKIGIPFRLQEIRNTVRKISSSGLPNSSDPRAEDYMIGQSTESWESALNEFLDAIKRMLHEAVNEVVEELFNKWNSTSLPEEVRQVVQDQLTLMLNANKEHSLQVLHAERLKPMTKHEKVLAFLIKEELGLLEVSRKNARAKAYVNEKENILGRRTEGPEREKKVQAVKDQELGEDPFKAELDVMARIRGYYNLASGELVDCISKLMRLELFQRCQQELAKNVSEALKLHTSEGFTYAKRLLAEDPEREAKREQVSKELEKLMNAKKLLDELPKY